MGADAVVTAAEEEGDAADTELREAIADGLGVEVGYSLLVVGIGSGDHLRQVGLRKDVV